MMVCIICNLHIWKKYKGYRLHKNCIVPLQVKAELKGERSDIPNCIYRFRAEQLDKIKVNDKFEKTIGKSLKNNTVIIDDFEHVSIGYVKEEEWRDKPNQRRGEYFNNVKTIRR